MKKLIRDLVSRYPWLDEVRTSVLTKGATELIDFFNRSHPVTRVVSKEAQEFLESGAPCIIAIYHGRFGGMAHFFKDKSKVTGLVGLNRDGELLARFGKALGYNVVRGSTTYKAVEGALQIVHAAKSGQCPTLAVDGPKGPAFKVKPGVIRIAEITGLPIIPFTCMSRMPLTLRSWDKMTHGFWGTPFLYVIGDPITVPKNSSKEQRDSYCQLLEAEMDSLREFADTFWDPNKGAFAR